MHLSAVANFKREPKLTRKLAFQESTSNAIWLRKPFSKEVNMVDIAIPRPAATVKIPAAPATQAPAAKRMVGPFGSGESGNKPPVKPPVPTNSPLEIELAEIRRAWRKYRSTNSRDAVYIYLASVFGIVTRWEHLNCAQNKSQAFLRRLPNPPQMKPEPFGIIIFCTADPRIVDAKTRSKWSRALRYAARAKRPGQRLSDFVKSNGGINECASKFRIAG